MDIRFKWNMFITSFIPLWVSIVIADLWDMAEYVLLRLDRLSSQNFDLIGGLVRFWKANALMIVSIIVISVVVGVSIIEIKAFLKQREKDKNPPKGRLVEVSRANKLSAEFLLAYILPMIAFDFSKGKSVMLFVMYFTVLAYLCIRNNNIYTNIYLELKQYRMYECDVECRVANGKQIYRKSLVISRRDLVTRVDCELKYWDFDNYIFIDLGKDN